jgi:hypothetical protein
MKEPLDGWETDGGPVSAQPVLHPGRDEREAVSVMTVHAWFSAATALTDGSSMFRKPSGATVNVTRMSSEKDAKGHFPYDEKYLGEVVRPADGGCVRPTTRVPGITD